MTTVYLVDDDPLVRDSLGMALKLETPYDVRVFQSGGAALAAVAENPADVVITDFKMPGMDGLELLRNMRARLPDAILMLLTGYADKDSAIQAVNEVGIFQYVEKPWDLHDLLLKLKAGLEQKELQRRLRETTADLERRHAELERSHADLERAHAQLERAQERLVASERMAAVGRVASGIAHELGNQVALVGYAEAIKARSGGNAEISELADVIASAQKRLAAMVGEIKDFARTPEAVAESPRILPEPADVASVVDEALAILRYDRDVGTRRLVRDYRSRPLARLDRGKFAQVIINLVRNAAQASQPRAAITLTLEDAGGPVIKLTVADEGSGMPPEVLARLGEPFFSTRGDRGTGLGIGISRRIVEEHGGSLSFESEVGRGTRAVIHLPGLS
jgi:C4-dicarboxylate-specific signal transduction histidine kinase